MPNVTVYLDIDGVVNVFDGWRLISDDWMTEKMGKPFYRSEAPEHLTPSFAAGYSLLLNPQHPEWLGEIEAAGAEFCWSTMWQDRAVTEFAPVAGFGSGWEYVDFHAHQKTLDWKRMRGAGVGAYKLPGWIAVNNDTDPIVIIDDDLEHVVYNWAAYRRAEGGPTLLIEPSPREGLTRAHVDTILEFVAEHTPVTTEAVA